MKRNTEIKLRKLIERIVKEEVKSERKQKFVLYTNPNNTTNRAYIAFGTEKSREVLNSARRYPGSYTILQQGKGTMDDVKQIISYMRNYNFGI